MSSLDALNGRSYGPFDFELSAAKVAEYVAATGDQSGRWTDYAPPSYAGAVLFKAAPSFLFDPEVAPHARLLIHGEQTFSWPQPWTIGSHVTATARVERIRERGGVAFATFVMDAHDDKGRHVLGSKAVFLMSAETPPGGGADERVEPPADERAENVIAESVGRPAGEEALIAFSKSASRSDLVRYASASEDFNPMHWDHDRAHAAGVGGVICHGLLMAAWATQPVIALTNRPDPLSEARFRFRLPLYPGDAAEVRALVTERTGDLVSAKSTVESAAGEHVAATMKLRTA